jgi:mannose-6-phosphate isomerase-like protein (cupin superfamily)/ABC-type transporter Mla MlaB component
VPAAAVYRPMATAPHTVAFSISGPISRADLPGLTGRVCALLREASAGEALCDVAGIEPDAVTVDALARLQLGASRTGCRVRLCNASPELLELVAFMGLENVLAEYGRRMADYTITNLRDAEDLAAKGGFSESQEARFPRLELGLETLGISHQVVKPDKHHAFGHRHKEAEEVYVVLSGSGRCRLDDEIVDVGKLDAIRVGPEVVRGFEAGPDGLELLVFGALAPGDAEIVEDFFAG